MAKRNAEIGKGPFGNNYVSPRSISAANQVDTVEWYNKHPKAALIIPQKQILFDGTTPLQYVVLGHKDRKEVLIKGTSGETVKYRVFFLADSEPPALTDSPTEIVLDDERQVENDLNIVAFQASDPEIIIT